MERGILVPMIFTKDLPYDLSNSRFGTTGSGDGPSVLMEGVGGQHEHHDKQNNNKEENKGWLVNTIATTVRC